MKIHCSVPSPVHSPDLLEIRIHKKYSAMGVFLKKDLDQKSQPEQLPEFIKAILVSNIVKQVVVIPGWAICVTLSEHVENIQFSDIKRLLSSIGHSFSPNTKVEVCGLGEFQLEMGRKAV